jgi:hypothetical protein
VRPKVRSWSGRKLAGAQTVRPKHPLHTLSLTKSRGWLWRGQHARLTSLRANPESCVIFWFGAETGVRNPEISIDGTCKDMTHEVFQSVRTMSLSSLRMDLRLSFPVRLSTPLLLSGIWKVYVNWRLSESFRRPPLSGQFTFTPNSLSDKSITVVPFAKKMCFGLDFLHQPCVWLLCKFDTHDA